ncbi:hypothetical protein ACIP2X_00595 [Streptomyces sp. NPDC089424]|uniref:hypothetical protein n=1 Tax=Streptomyces sp. NPDC089424 TaxID=3365917 RepID=UPI00381588D1
MAAVTGTLLLAGCTGGADEAADPPETSARPTADASTGSPAPSASPADEPYTVAEDRAPRTRAEAVAFVRGLAVRPDYFGVGFGKREPYESDPAEWAVLGEDCLWRRESLPDGVLASLTRGFVLPEADGKGPVQVSLTVTVHDDTLAARRDMAGSLEDALRCPEQRLNATVRVSGLYSRADPFSEQRNAITDDDLTESGTYVVDGEKGAHPFDWFKYRLGPVTVAATARTGAGRTKEEQTAVSSDVAKGVGFVAADIDRQAAAEEPAGKSGDSTPGTGTAGGTETAR